MSKQLRTAFAVQRAKAKQRGISFELDYEGWLLIWIKSGKLSQRGKKRGQYVMARFGDKGPYAAGNVKIIKVVKNLREWCVGHKHSDESKAKIGRASSLRVGWKHTEETKQKIARARLGQKPTEEARQNMRIARIEWLARHG
jgi:NUMOD3 motif